MVESWGSLVHQIVEPKSIGKWALKSIADIRSSPAGRRVGANSRENVAPVEECWPSGWKGGVATPYWQPATYRAQGGVVGASEGLSGTWNWRVPCS